MKRRLCIVGCFCLVGLVMVGACGSQQRKIKSLMRFGGNAILFLIAGAIIGLTVLVVYRIFRPNRLRLIRKSFKEVNLGLSDEQKMRRHIRRLKSFGIMDLIFAVMAYIGLYMARFLTRFSEGSYTSIELSIAFTFLYLIFLSGAFMAFDLVGIVRLLLTKVSECRERIELLENQISTLKGQEAKSS